MRSFKLIITRTPSTAFPTSQAYQSQSLSTRPPSVTCVTHPGTCSSSWWSQGRTSEPQRQPCWKLCSSWSLNQTHRPSNRQTRRVAGNRCAGSSSSATIQVHSTMHSAVHHVLYTMPYLLTLHYSASYRLTLIPTGGHILMPSIVSRLAVHVCLVQIMLMCTVPPPAEQWVSRLSLWG